MQLLTNKMWAIAYHLSYLKKWLANICRKRFNIVQTKGTIGPKSMLMSDRLTDHTPMSYRVHTNR